MSAQALWFQLDEEHNIVIAQGASKVYVAPRQTLGMIMRLKRLQKEQDAFAREEAAK